MRLNSPPAHLSSYITSPVRLCRFLLLSGLFLLGGSAVLTQVTRCDAQGCSPGDLVVNDVTSCNGGGQYSCGAGSAHQIHLALQRGWRMRRGLQPCE